MILLIHTADITNVYLGLIERGQIIAERKFKAQYQQAEKLLPEIDKLLLKKGIKLSNLKSFGVVAGPGPFTALRIGIAAANTLAWALGKPAFGVKLNEFTDEASLAKICELRSKKAKVGAIIEPFYGREPNITIKKEIKS